ncbi:8-oxoguanine DNA glycosylase OGG fold protein [Streptomyces halstedii]|uniref:8-oxoguanine DNA glycosylase OGG fold protein n=1 Tax=Streptomyces halstedii TaxID=1944 RepID=UPI003697A2D8
MLEHPLPADAVGKLGAWLAGDGAPYADGTGEHADRYIPASWADILPWPAALAEQVGHKPTSLSRAQVLAVARTGAATATWTETLIASYVWGQGDNGYGAYRLGEILRPAPVGELLAQAVAVLATDGAVAGYRRLSGAIARLGPAFFIKFLYFAGVAVVDAPGPCPLILDQRIARVLRAYTTRLGEEIGLEEPAKLAAWLWSDGGWTSHRYDVYLRWAHVATDQLAGSTHWPLAPDLLELALFSGAWNPYKSSLGPSVSDTPSPSRSAALSGPCPGASGIPPWTRTGPCGTAPS